MAAARALFVHGAGAGAWEWQIWRRVFEARDVCCASVELEPSPAGLAATRYQDYLASVIRAADVFAPQLLVGASLGGLLAAEAAATYQPERLVLLAPIPPSGLSGDLRGPLIRWANDPQLSRTRKALPDADSAACAYAHARWRDESAQVLREAYAGRSFHLSGSPALIVAAEADTEIPLESLVAWAHRDSADLWRERTASHAGLVLGGDAARLAERVLLWAGIA